MYKGGSMSHRKKPETNDPGEVPGAHTRRKHLLRMAAAIASAAAIGNAALAIGGAALPTENPGSSTTHTACTAKCTKPGELVNACSPEKIGRLCLHAAYQDYLLGACEHLGDEKGTCVNLMHETPKSFHQKYVNSYKHALNPWKANPRYVFNALDENGDGSISEGESNAAYESGLLLDKYEAPYPIKIDEFLRLVEADAGTSLFLFLMCCSCAACVPTTCMLTSYRHARGPQRQVVGRLCHRLPCCDGRFLHTV